MRRTAYLLILLLIFSQFLAAKGRTVKGFITGINGDRTRMTIREKAITIPPDVHFEIEDNDRNLQLSLKDLRIGLRVKVTQASESEGRSFIASTIFIDADQFEEDVERTAFIHHLHDLQTGSSGPTGSLCLDGQKLKITPNTDLVFSDSLKEVRPGDMGEYRGSRNMDGTLTASRLVVRENRLEEAERELRDQTVSSRAFDQERREHGRLRVGSSRFKTYYNRRLHEYVRQVGESLVPDYQLDLPEGDPRKIDPRFYVIDEEDYPNAFSFPSGVIVVNTAVLLLMENEAQLAFVLAHEMAHLLNEHTYRQRTTHRKKRLVLKIASIAIGAVVPGLGGVIFLTDLGITNTYQRYLEDQADRCALQLAAENGYNPLESIRVWARIKSNFGDIPSFLPWVDHSSYSKRIDNLLTAIRNNFPSRTSEDFSAMKLGTVRYLSETEVLRKDPRLTHLREKIR